MGAELLGGFAPGEWLVPGEPAAQNPIVNDAFWSTAAGKAERLLLGIENLALSVRQRSTSVGGS
jgi:hypothetical protein